MNKNNILISIIIPIYNADKYLAKCINSVISQTYTSWELLLINDGSTDKSLEICNSFALKDSRISIINKSNSGVADTRNKGLDQAKGDYIIFLDADDYWILNNSLNILVNTAIEYKLDIVRGDYIKVDMLDNIISHLIDNDARKAYNKKIISSIIFHQHIVNLESYLWLSLIKKDAIGNLRFNDKWDFLEDMEFYSRLLLRPLSCMYLNIVFYAYRNNNNSIVNTKCSKNLLDSFRMSFAYHEYSIKASDFYTKKYYQEKSILQYYRSIQMLTEDNDYYHLKKLITKELSQLQKCIPKWIEEYGESLIFDPCLQLPTKLSIEYWRIRNYYLKRYYQKMKHK